MKQTQTLITSAEKDYELLDSGDGQKLERFGKFVLSRPDPQALWSKNLSPAEWDKADGVFNRGGNDMEDSDDGKGKTSSKNQSSSKDRWKLKAGVPEKWQINFAGLKFFIEPTPFKHVGLFPEQKSNWGWIINKIKEQRAKSKNKEKKEIDNRNRGAESAELSTARGLFERAEIVRVEGWPVPPDRPEGEVRFCEASSAGLEKVPALGASQVLNLFGYTGGATLACAQAGASVVHVDGSKVSIKRAKENVELSGLANKPIRWMLDDAREFVKRELRRGNKYDGIIMDPPSFGRGDKGQVWKIEDDFVPFFNDCLKLLSDKPIFFLINGYAAGYSSIAYANNLKILQERFGGGIEYGELVLEEGNKGKSIPTPKLRMASREENNRFLPCGIFARWNK
jgi:23S rRNA (cytosine1962-C5)-methyltransferase